MKLKDGPSRSNLLRPTASFATRVDIRSPRTPKRINGCSLTVSQSRLVASACAWLLALMIFGGCDRSRSNAAPPDAGVGFFSTSATDHHTSAPTPPSAQVSSYSIAATPPNSVLVETRAMGTLVRFYAYPGAGKNEATTREAIAKALEELRRIERLMSPKLAESDLAQLNTRAGDRVKVSKDTFDVIDKSLWVAKVSSGAFDITFATMSDLWKFGDALDSNPSPPSLETVAQRRSLVDWTKVETDARTLEVKVPKGRRIGLGGIAKGYGVDRASAVLRAEGVTDFMIQAGGDLYASGTKPSGEPWLGGIQDPRAADGSPFATLQLRDCGLSTAGDYERYYFADGKRYHHIIDPKTGYPSTASRSVSIWAPNAFMSDAIDDAVFILGPEKGLALVESLPDIGAVIVDGQNNVWVSKRMQNRVRVLREPTPATP
jgi:FAD:protein FMN transferase